MNDTHTITASLLIDSHLDFPHPTGLGRITLLRCSTGDIRDGEHQEGIHLLELL